MIFIGCSVTYFEKPQPIEMQLKRFIHMSCHNELCIKVFIRCSLTSISDPIPMRMRALPQSFWQQPNTPANAPPGASYPLLPSLFSRDTGDDDVAGGCHNVCDVTLGMASLR